MTAPQRWLRSSIGGSAAVVSVVLLVTAPAHARYQGCIGDCDENTRVTVAEILTMVNLSLNGGDVSVCTAGDADIDFKITIDEILTAVNNAFAGCPTPTVTATPTSTPTPLSPSVTPTPTTSGVAEEFVAQASDFECLTNWNMVRHYRITNKLDHLTEALGVASASFDVSGLHFPVGTIVQLIPTEAMVKRGGGFDPANNDWEYFSLKVSRTGTQIAKRGRDEVSNPLGNCFICHSAAHEHDFICENNHGCVPIPIDAETAQALQEADIRCHH